eukprot:m.13745 g.13745  ORF g.13745 m.13745 type:complete len:64 (+) comp8220_c0_seq1:84-275(+)
MGWRWGARCLGEVDAPPQRRRNTRAHPSAIDYVVVILLLCNDDGTCHTSEGLRLPWWTQWAAV